MYRKTEERRQNLSSELRNAFVVKNKCEQLKLEKQQKSLDRLRAHESLDLMNKKREILSLQMSILSNSKPDDNTKEISCVKPREATQPQPEVYNINGGTRKMKFRSRALSISASSIHTFLSNNVGKESRVRRPSLSPNYCPDGETMNHYKAMSRSVSVSGGLDCFTRRNWSTQPNSMCSTENETKVSESNSAEKNGRTSGQAVWGLLPPIQLAPLHKQKSKSVKDMSAKPAVRAVRKLSADNISWNELQDCRYLRSRWKQ